MDELPEIDCRICEQPQPPYLLPPKPPRVRCEKNGWEWLCLMIIELLDGDSKPLKEELLWRSRSKL